MLRQVCIYIWSGVVDLAYKILQFLIAYVPIRQSMVIAGCLSSYEREETGGHDLGTPHCEAKI